MARETRHPAPGTAPALVPSARARSALVKRLAGATSQMTTATLAAMEQRHPWFAQLDAEERSWITLVARGGIDGFVQWFAADETAASFSPAGVFDAAPRALTRKITLHQTVDLVRTTIAVVEEQIQTLLPKGDRQVLSVAIVHYSREVAFGAAEVYARAAEVRGSWDARLEALVVDAVVRSEADETVVSRASTLGWQAGHPVCVAVGAAPHENGSVDALRQAAERQKLAILASTQGDRLVVICSGAALTDDVAAVDLVRRLRHHFGAGPVVVGPLVDDLVDASTSARAALAGVRAAVAWPEGAETLSALDLVPERVLSGDGHARSFARDVHRRLAAAGGDLLETCVSFLDHGCSVEATARGLYVHANTVRYRLKRIQDVTGYSPMNPRDAYVLRLAITLGRLAQTR